VEQIPRLSNSLSDPDTRLDLERLHHVVARQGTSWVGDGPHLPIPRQRQVHLGKDDQAKMVAAYLTGDSVRNLASAYQIHRGTVSEILSRHGVSRPRGPRQSNGCGK